MKQHKKFVSQEEQGLVVQHQAAQNSVQEFATVEELLRHDAAKTSAPANIAERLQKSSAGFPGPARSWWQRLFGE